MRKPTKTKHKAISWLLPSRNHTIKTISWSQYADWVPLKWRHESLWPVEIQAHGPQLTINLLWTEMGIIIKDFRQHEKRRQCKLQKDALRERRRRKIWDTKCQHQKRDLNQNIWRSARHAEFFQDEASFRKKDPENVTRRDKRKS